MDAQVNVLNNDFESKEYLLVSFEFWLWGVVFLGVLLDGFEGWLDSMGGDLMESWILEFEIGESLDEEVDDFEEV